MSLFEIIISLALVVFGIVVLYRSSDDKRFDERQIEERMRAFRNGFIMVIALTLLIGCYAYIMTKAPNHVFSAMFVYNVLLMIFLFGMTTMTCTNILHHSYVTKNDLKPGAAAVAYITILILYSLMVASSVKDIFNKGLNSELFSNIIYWICLVAYIASYKIREYKDKKEEEEDV